MHLEHSGSTDIEMLRNSETKPLAERKLVQYQSRTVQSYASPLSTRALSQMFR